MNKIKIITDSCSDLPKDLREKYDIDYAKMNTVYNGKETPASLDWEYYSPKEFYDIMRGGERFTTTQVPMEEFRRVFEKYVAEGCDIVYVGCSLRLSSSVNTGIMVAKELAEEYPEREIYCVNSKCSCWGEGALAIRAAEYRDQGLSAKEIAERIEKECNTMNQFATVDNLNALKRAGRVKASAAFFGNLFNVKPILISDALGNNFAVKKVKGRKNSMLELVKMAKEAAEGVENQTVYVVHADCEEDLNFLVDEVRKEIPCKEIRTGYIGPIIGASIGPGAVAIYIFGKEIVVEG